MIHTEHLSTLFIILFIKDLSKNRLSTGTATVVDPVVSNKGGSLCVLFVTLIHSYYYSVT